MSTSFSEFLPYFVYPTKSSSPLPMATQTAKDALDTLNFVLLGELYFKISLAPLETFTATTQGVTLVNTPVASYALGVWDASEPVLCSVAGTPSEETFFSLARAKFRKPGVTSLSILKANKKCLNMFELSINDLRFLIQYRQAPVAPRPELLRGLLVGSNSTVDTIATRKSKVYSDTVYLLKHIPDLTVFRAAYSAIKSWALSQGIYSGRFRYLAELQLLVLVAHVCQRIALPYTAEPAIQEFFVLYSTASFDTRVVFSDEFGKQTKADPRPIVDFAKSTTRETFRVIENRIKAYANPSEGLKTSLCLPTFASEYRSYIKVDLSYWGSSSSTKGGRFVEMVDTALADWISSSTSSRRCPGLIPWPFRVKDDRKESSSESYEAFYIVAIDSASPDPPLELESYLTDLLSRLLTTVRSSAYYNPNTTFVDATITSEFSPHHLIPDPKTWGLIPDEPTPDDSSDEEEPPAVDTEFWVAPKHKQANKGRSSKNKRSAENLASAQPVSASQPLRPALDILNRIRHDAGLDAEDYVIGYLDRHSGIKEMPVAWWKGENKTEEDFIPQSRIKYYKRKSDGVVVWDRVLKVDLVFGSGVSGEERSG